MKDGFPAGQSSLPDGRAASPASVVLQQHVGEQVKIWSKLLAAEIRGLPEVFVRSAVALCEFVEHEVARVCAAGGADLPEVRHSHVLEVGAGGAQLDAMEEGLAAR